jgi:hypothetical protein
MNTDDLKKSLLEKWIIENSSFDNDKETFEDFLVRQMKFLNKQKEIDGLLSHLKIEIHANEKLRGEYKNLQLQMEKMHSEDLILYVLNKYYTDSAPNQHIKQNIIENLKKEIL